jgi:hypothetical protein
MFVEIYKFNNGSIIKFGTIFVNQSKNLKNVFIIKNKDHG